MVNFLDTDHWFDRLNNDFPQLKESKRALLYDAGTNDPAQQKFKEAVDRYARRLYSLLEDHAQEPWFFGSRFSAVDVYVAVMTRWRPGRAWFAEHAPRLLAIATNTETLDRLAAVWSKNFPAD